MIAALACWLLVSVAAGLTLGRVVSDRDGQERR